MMATVRSVLESGAPTESTHLWSIHAASQHRTQALSMNY